MYCSNCGEQVEKESRFCPSCGQKMKRPEVNEQRSLQDTEKKGSNNVTSAEKSSTNSRSSRVDTNSKGIILFPIVALALVVCSIFPYYYYQEHKTKMAIDSFHKGEEYALHGDYEKALDAFNKSLSLRPQFENAEKNKSVVDKAIKVTNDLNSAKDLQKKEKFSSSLQKISNAEETLIGYKGDLITKLKKLISNNRVTTMVAQLRYDIKGKTTIEELAPILQRAEDLKVPEAKTIANEIRGQLVDVSYNEANKHLKDNEFSDALASINNGLKYAANDKKLTKLKTNVEKEKNAFESAEKRKMEQAMVAAAKERENNLNNAVELENVDVNIDEYGDATVSGTVKSIATVPISGVEVFYTLYDSNGDEYDTNSIYIDSYTLNPGDTSIFEYTHYGVDTSMKVKVTGYTWYLDN